MIGSTRIEHPIGRGIGGRGGIGNICLKVGLGSALVGGVGLIPPIAFLSYMSEFGTDLALGFWIVLIVGFMALLLLDRSSLVIGFRVLLLEARSISGSSVILGIGSSLVGISGFRLILVIGSVLILVTGSVVVVGFRSNSKSRRIIWCRKRTICMRNLTLNPRFVAKKVTMEIGKSEGSVPAGCSHRDYERIVLRSEPIENRHYKVLIRVGVSDECKFVGKTAHGLKVVGAG